MRIIKHKTSIRTRFMLKETVGLKITTVMSTARLRILEYLINHGDGTAAEMSAELSDIPTASLYRHIKALDADGWIEVKSETKKRGATERRYKLSTARVNDSGGGVVQQGLLELSGEFRRYFDGDDPDPERDMLGFSMMALMLSDEELASFYGELGAVAEKYMGRAPDGVRKPRKITVISSPIQEEQ